MCMYTLGDLGRERKPGGNQDPAASCRNPNGLNILSFTTLFATCPPRCNATAPTMAYRAVCITTGKPDAVRSVTCNINHSSALRFPSRPHSDEGKEAYPLRLPPNHLIQPIPPPQLRRPLLIHRHPPRMRRQPSQTLERFAFLSRAPSLGCAVHCRVLYQGERGLQFDDLPACRLPNLISYLLPLSLSLALSVLSSFFSPAGMVWRAHQGNMVGIYIYPRKPSARCTPSARDRSFCA